MKIEPITEPDDRLFIENIYRKYALYLTERAYRITGDENVCEDLFHDCIIILIKHISTLKKLDEERLKAFISASIDNTAKNYVLNSEKLSSDGEEDAEDISGNTEEIIEYRIRCETVRKKICELPERDRVLIKLKYDLRLHDREIADIVGIKEESVRMTVRRSVTRLKKKLGVIKSYESVQ